MNHKRHGFTLVELLIVIVVIAILATLSVVAYNGIQARARNVQTLSAMKTTERLIKLYLAEKGTMATGIIDVGPENGRCVTIGYPNRQCRDFASSTTGYPETNNSLSVVLDEYGDLPEPSEPVGGTVGPYVLRYAGPPDHLRIVSAFEGESCPAGTETSWNDPDSSRILCLIMITL